MAKRIDRIGQRYGRWLVLSYAGPQAKSGTAMWHCRCDCGTERAVIGRYLGSGVSMSCGCAIRERHTTHGYSNTPTFTTWQGMLNRCNAKTNTNFDKYGGRGITVCSRWLKFENFLEDMGERPDGHSLDRIDVNGNYEPGNCRWATQHTQSNNRRDNVIIEFRGEQRTIADWSRHLGINPITLGHRLNTYGWSVERALTTPVQKKRKRRCGNPPTLPERSDSSS